MTDQTYYLVYKYYLDERLVETTRDPYELQHEAKYQLNQDFESLQKTWNPDHKIDVAKSDGTHFVIKGHNVYEGRLEHYKIEEYISLDC